ncbi:MAG: RNA polymerase factor sigma-54 [Gammaproteobacteria bacterium]|nr:RNA polymerase factor sigma-54 [Gammaproteobacteria bacterium]
MKPTLELKLGQHLTITPQLQQAIRLLQLSSLELQQEIQEALETNPLLEEEESITLDKTDQSLDADFTPDTDLEATDDRMDHVGPSENDISPEDHEWQQANDFTSSSTSNRADGDDLPDLESRNSAPESLRDHLEWQLHMTPMSARDLEIAYTLIDSINDDGYLSTTIEDIAETVSHDLPKDEPVEIEEVEAVLHQVQNFDPLGVGARDLAECIQIQLRQLPTDTPWLDAARSLATTENLATLARRDSNLLKKLTKLSNDELQGAVSLIQAMNPRPGAGVNAPQAAYVIPDVIVRKYKGIWRVELNGEVSPRLRVNEFYHGMINTDQAGKDKKYLQEQLQHAKWFIKSVNSRNDTLLKVARTIVDRQRAFFDHGPEAMKPLVLHDIAEAVEMHESTISRVTTNKYMLTPRGILELKYFFSSHVSTSDGGTCSATAIRSLIRKLVEEESPDKPISDSKIAKLLEAEGINVARRTVAKYRESMNIPPSSQRKALV